MRTYTYNAITGILELTENDESIYLPLAEYVADHCVFAGIGVGKSEIITSTGPFSGEMKTLNKRIIADITCKVHGALLTGLCEGSLNDLNRIIEQKIGFARQRITDIEISCKVGMFQALRTAVREQFDGAS